LTYREWNTEGQWGGKEAKESADAEGNGLLANEWLKIQNHRVISWNYFGVEWWGKTDRGVVDGMRNIQIVDKNSPIVHA